MDGNKLFRRDRQGRMGGVVVLYLRECLDCLELNGCDNRVECLRVRFQGRSTRQISWWVSVIDPPPKQDEEAEGIFCKQLRKVSQSLALVLGGLLLTRRLLEIQQSREETDEEAPGGSVKTTSWHCWSVSQPGEVPHRT